MHVDCIIFQHKKGDCNWEGNSKKNTVINIPLAFDFIFFSFSCSLQEVFHLLVLSKLLKQG